jgi:hypothetical protein
MLTFGIISASCNIDGDNIDGDNAVLKFDLTNANALFAGPSNAATSRSASREASSGNIILLKQDTNGDIQEAVSGISGQFIIQKMLNNPVTNELFLLGYLGDYGIIRVDKNSNHYGLSADTYHYYQNSGFDAEGAFYFTTTSSTPGQPAHLWRYRNNTATSLAEGSSGAAIGKVLSNGYVLYSVDSGTYLRAPDGSLTPWGWVQGIYSSNSDVWYYGNKGFRFDTMTEFTSGATDVTSGNDFDATGPSFLIIEKTKITKYTIQADKTLTETSILSGYNIDFKTIAYYGEELFVKCSGEVIYFAGKDSSNQRNLFKIDGGAPVPILTGLDNNNYTFANVSFADDGKFVASVQQLSTGKYGALNGDFTTGEYSFTERNGFTQVVDVLMQ